MRRSAVAAPPGAGAAGNFVVGAALGMEVEVDAVEFEFELDVEEVPRAVVALASRGILLGDEITKWRGGEMRLVLHDWEGGFW